MVVAFTFHNMIPSLMSYLGSRALMLKAGNSTFRFSVTRFLWDTLSGVCLTVTKAVQGDLKSGQM
jgi:hypothetical protein